MNNKPIVGVDFGGTKIMTGIINPEGKIIGKPVTILTGGSDDKEKILERLFTTINETLIRAGLTVADIRGIGIGATGPLDSESGIILECPQLPTMNHFPLKTAVKEHYKIPIFLDNDANCLILGESCFGAGKGHEIILGFTLGTGLGCGIVFNNKIFRGATQTAGEVWASPFGEGAIEDYVSGAGVSRIYKTLGGGEKSAKEICELAESGDKTALNTWKQFGEVLAFAISWGINFIDPDIVILGGSISNAWQWFNPSMDKYLRKHICPNPALKTKIVPAELGKHAGYIGAACLILQNKLFS